MKKILNYLTLLSSFGTLICCALPALLVSVGLGSTLVSLTSIFPQLIWISENKILVFILAGMMLSFALLSVVFSKQKECPIDPDLAIACLSAKSFSSYILGLSIALYLIGFFFAFIWPLIF